MSDKAYTVIGTNVVIDCGTVEEAIAYERELWANQPYAPATPAPLDIPTIVGLLNSDHGFRIQTITSGEQDCRCWFHVAARKAIEPLPATPAPLDVQTTTTDDDAWLTGKTQTRQVPEWASEGYHHTERPERDATPAPLDEVECGASDTPMSVRVSRANPAMDIEAYLIGHGIEHGLAHGLADDSIAAHRSATPASLPDVRGEVLPIMLRPAVDMDTAPAPLDGPYTVAKIEYAADDFWDVLDANGEKIALCGEADARLIAAALNTATPAPLDDNTVTINLRRWVESLIAHADDKDGMVWVTKAEIVSVLALATPAPLDAMCAACGHDDPHVKNGGCGLDLWREGPPPYFDQCMCDGRIGSRIVRFWTATPAPLDVERLTYAFRKGGARLHEETWHVHEDDLPAIAAAYAEEMK